MESARNRPLVRRGWRYTLVGLVCALANYAIMLVVDYRGGHYLLGTVVAFMVVTPLAYVLQSRFTFGETFRAKAFLRFVAAVASAYPIAVAVLALLCSGLGLSVAIATPIATIALFAWNFAAAHWAILSRFNLPSATVADGRPTRNGRS